MDTTTNVTIILPCYNSNKHLSAAVDSIRDNTEYPNWKLYLIESESNDGTAELCDDYVKCNNNIFVFHTKREGITKAINFGISKADPQSDVYLTQDDVIIPKLYGRDWLTELVKISKQENCGAVTTINAGGISGPSYLDGFKWTGTWSLYIPRKTINKIGILDENFSPGPGDDVDYSYRIAQAGLNILQANFWVDHHRMTENFNDKIEDVKKRNAEYFREKHHIANWSKEIDNYPLQDAMEYLKFINIEIEKRSELRFLDYGSGNGRDAFVLLAKGGTTVDCCDISLENLKIAASNLGNFMRLRANFILLFSNDRIPVLDETYDFINCNGVLHHADNPKEIVRELHRVLKPNGQMAVMLYTEKLH